MKQFDSFLVFCFFTVFLLYFCQDIFYTNRILAQGVLFIYLCICVFYFIKMLSIKTFLFSRYLTAFLLLNTFYFIFIWQLHTTEAQISTSISQYKVVLCGLMPFYPSYYLSKRGVLTANKLLWFFGAFFILFGLRFFHTQASLLAEITNETIDAVTNNDAYNFVVLIPALCLLNKHKFFSFLFLGGILFFIIMGAKRGAIITGGVATLLYLKFIFFNRDRKIPIYQFLLICIAICSLCYFVYQWFLSNELLQLRLESTLEGDSSARDVIYFTLWEHWISGANLFSQILGSGFCFTLAVIGDLAHNDWLQILTDFGLIGVFIYAMLFYAIVKYIKQNRNRLDTSNRYIILLVMVMWIIKSMFSMGYCDIVGMGISTILLGYTMGENNSSALQKTTKN